MSVLVGIPTHRRPELLRACLASIAAQEGELPPVRVFVADNDPRGRDGARVAEEIAPSYRFPISSTVVEEPGISAVRNAILAEARRGGDEFIAWLDDDMRADADWLYRLVRQAGESGAAIVGGPVIKQFQHDVPSHVRQAFAVADRPSGPTTHIYGTGGVLVSCDLLARNDYPQFDLSYGLTGGEDAEWFLRLADMGGKMAWAAEARSFEFVPPERATIQWLWRRNLRIGVNQIQLARQRKQSKLLLLIKAAGVIALTPFFAVRLISPDRRASTIIRWSRAVGRLSCLIGFRYNEYAERHDTAIKAR